MVLEDHTHWVSTLISVVIVLVLTMVFLTLVVTMANYANLMENKSMDIKVKDIVKTEYTYIIFDTDNNMYAYSKLLPEISVGKNYIVKKFYTISEYYNFYKIDEVVEI